MTIKTLFKFVFILASMASLAFVPWNIISIWVAPLPDTLQQQLEQALKHGFDGAIVYIDEAGQPPQLLAAGWKNRQNKIPADPHAYFKIASISKLYIAVAVAKLIDQKVLHQDDTLADLLPAVANKIENADTITLRMLVQHRSGIYNYSDNPDFPWDNPPDNSGALALFINKPSNFTPDSDYEYSNSNYLLLGAIMDRALGYSHHQFIRQQIVQPLGLTHTFSLLKDVNLEDVTSGYFHGYKPDIKGNDFVNPGGSMVATAEDVGIFIRALNDGSLLTDSEQTIYSSLYQYGHTGLLPGYSSIARYHKDIDAVVVLLVNTNGGDSWSILEIVYQRIIDILHRHKQAN